MLLLLTTTGYSLYSDYRSKQAEISVQWLQTKTNTLWEAFETGIRLTIDKNNEMRLYFWGDHDYDYWDVIVQDMNHVCVWDGNEIVCEGDMRVDSAESKTIELAIDWEYWRERPFEGLNKITFCPEKQTAESFVDFVNREKE